jgi:molybdopterin/thiamine biosynthesis adenylyltransferase/DNA-binding transcriptional regulator YhcF (GntR family)
MYGGQTSMQVERRMKIQPVTHRTLAEIVAGRLAASLLAGTLKPGERLPSERELIGLLEVSRATLREGLKSLEQNRLIEAQQGVGWFACPMDDNNVARARELAEAYEQRTAREDLPASSEPPTGPRRLPAVPEKPLHIPNLKTDRAGTFELISWWERKKVEAARVLVVGAGALGNEVIKNLALMGIGHILVIDFDTIEAANLSRSVLFRDGDNQRSKAEVAASRAKSLNPDIHVQYLHGDVTSDLGLGIIRRMDVVIGCLDNREARLSVNRFCYWMGKAWVDGAIQELLGLVRVFVPGQGACYECTLSEQARRDLSLRYSCPLLARENILLGKVPTTPTIASIIGAMQAQEALKLIHGLPVEPGKVTHFNGMTNELHSTAYLPREDCESHWAYGEVVELPAKAESTTLAEMLRIIRSDLGPQAVIELDHELVTRLTCPECRTSEPVIQPLPRVSFEAAHCPECGVLREAIMTHLITGQEDFLQRSLNSIGIPALHILRARNDVEYRFYELTGDAPGALHFRHFEGPEPVAAPAHDRIRLQGEVAPENPARGRVVLRE